MIKDVQAIITEDNVFIDLDEYHASFFGYDLELASIDQKSYNVLYGNKKKFVLNEHETHKLTVSFLVDGFENMLYFSGCLDNVTMKFTDGSVSYECMKSDYDYEYISGITYQINFIYDCYIFGNEKKLNISSDIETIFVNSSMPTPINLEITAIKDITNKTIVLIYFDYFLNRLYENRIKIKNLSKNHILFIDSRNFICKDNDVLKLNDIEINLYPVTKGRIRFEGVDNSLSVKLVYRSEY